MAQTVCVRLDEAATSRLTALATDRSCPLKHILRARIVLLSGERLTVQEIARQAGGDCQEFRVGAAIVDPKEVPDGTTQSTPHP